MDKPTETPTKPIIGRDMDTFSGCWWYVCPACRISVDYKVERCPHCSQPFDWKTKGKGG